MFWKVQKRVINNKQGIKRMRLQKRKYRAKPNWYKHHTPYFSTFANSLVPHCLRCHILQTSQPLLSLTSQFLPFTSFTLPSYICFMIQSSFILFIWPNHPNVQYAFHAGGFLLNSVYIHSWPFSGLHHRINHHWTVGRTLRNGSISRAEQPKL